jgi:hypothetical protein
MIVLLSVDHAEIQAFRKTILPTKVSLLEVYVWFPASEMMLLSQQVASGRYEGQSEGGLLSR